MAKRRDDSEEKVQPWEIAVIALIWLLAISLAVILFMKVRFALNN